MDFADGLGLLGVFHITEGMKAAIKETLIRIGDWIFENGMTLAHQKIEAIMFMRKWAYHQPVFISNGHGVILKRAVK